ncbi:hypothetical protein B0H13DRAFT_1922811 [Mycena leptocephala]|nr:hypothetical protein B0H13DRAFT_1922811 [Mycena leptocephala]
MYHDSNAPPPVPSNASADSLMPHTGLLLSFDHNDPPFNVDMHHADATLAEPSKPKSFRQQHRPVPIPPVHSSRDAFALLPPINTNLRGFALSDALNPRSDSSALPNAPTSQEVRNLHADGTVRGCLGSKLGSCGAINVIHGSARVFLLRIFWKRLDIPKVLSSICAGSAVNPNELPHLELPRVRSRHEHHRFPSAPPELQPGYVPDSTMEIDGPAFGGACTGIKIEWPAEMSFWFTFPFHRITLLGDDADKGDLPFDLEIDERGKIITAWSKKCRKTTTLHSPHCQECDAISECLDDLA